MPGDSPAPGQTPYSCLHPVSSNRVSSPYLDHFKLVTMGRRAQLVSSLKQHVSGLGSDSGSSNEMVATSDLSSENSDSQSETSTAEESESNASSIPLPPLHRSIARGNREAHQHAGPASVPFPFQKGRAPQLSLHLLELQWR